jgi:cytochrome c-type biogenesis protein CcmE
MGGKKLKFLIGGLVVVAAIASLAFFAVRENMVYYYTVTELQDKGASTNVRVSGDLVSGTLVKGNVGEPIKFKIFDPADKNKVVFVTYTGAVPDTFKDDPANQVQVVVEGDYLTDGTFNADFLLAKCPSKYEKAQADTATTSATGQ